MRITRKRTCPYCKRNDALRIQRSNWMRFFPNSKKYECNFCRREYLVIGAEDEHVEVSLKSV